MKRVILSLTALGTCAAIMFSLFGGVFAAPSDEIQKEIDRLEEQADELADKQKEIDNQLAAKNAETAGYAEEKMRIDNELELARLEAGAFAHAGAAAPRPRTSASSSTSIIC